MAESPEQCAIKLAEYNAVKANRDIELAELEDIKKQVSRAFAEAINFSPKTINEAKNRAVIIAMKMAMVTMAFTQQNELVSALEQQLVSLSEAYTAAGCGTVG